MQVRGFNGFSYADVAAELRLSKAALHYHFATKAELGEALLVRYSQRFAAALAGIDAEPLDAPAKLAAYANLYLDVLRQDRMCLCGMIAAEYQTLPEPMQAIVIQFFLDNETWLRNVLEQGRTEGTIRAAGGTTRCCPFDSRQPRRRHARCPTLPRRRPFPSRRRRNDHRAPIDGMTTLEADCALRPGAGINGQTDNVPGVPFI